jgi:multidrug efflux pump subunit AcrB
MNISKFFIDRPIFAGVLSVLILLAGIISLFKLPISEYPEVVPPSVVVHAQYRRSGGLAARRADQRRGKHVVYAVASQ